MRTRDGREVETRGEFTDQEWSLLQRFADCADELRRTHMAQGSRTGFEMKVSPDEETSWKSDLPPDDDISAFMHRLRPFVLEGEETHFGRIWNILRWRMSEPHIQAALDVWKSEFWNQNPADLSISAGDVRINAEETLKKWLNAFQYHRDQDKAKELNELLAGFPTEVSRAIFVMMLVSKGNACIELSKAIRAIENRAASES
jgi:hypothetical protein